MSDFRKRETRKLVDPQREHFMIQLLGWLRKSAKANKFLAKFYSEKGARAVPNAASTATLESWLRFS
jgi:hypothetical protein